MNSPPFVVRSVWIWLAATVLIGTALAAPRIQVQEQEVPVLEIRPVGLATPVPGQPGSWRIEVDEKGGGGARFGVVWPAPGSEVTIDLRAEQAYASPGRGRKISLEAIVEFPDGRRVRAERPLSFDRPTTVLFEVYRDADRSLTLAVAADVQQRTVYTTRPVPGRPLKLHLEIVRVDAGKTISLETNDLNTLVGESVSYSFDLGGPDAESVRLTLTPRRIVGEIVEIDAEISGKLPGADELRVMGRKEQWVTSRGTTSTLPFEFGEPPTGYRFLVTPEF